MAEPREDRTDRSRTSQENDSPTSTRAETEEPAFKYEAGQRAQSSSSTAAPAAQPQMEEQPAKPKPSKLQQIWKKIDLDIGTLLMMFKGSVPPLIGIAFYQADSVASTFTSLGYLVPIITVLCMAIMPRAKYFQTLILNTLGVCVGSAVALLGIWTGVKARENTTAPGSTATYNSSQSAVCGIWLFANIWFVNVLRAKFPALAFPVIMYSIFSNIAFTYGPLFPNIAAGESLIKQLLTGFLTAFGISTGVNLFIIPVSSRTVVFKEQAGYIMALRGTIKATAAYITSLETSDMFAPPVVEDNGHSKKKSKKDDKENGSHPANNTQAIALKGAIAGLTGLHGKLHGDMSFAKREMAWGKLDANDIEEIFTLFRSIIIPLIGLSTIVDIFERIAERRGWVKTTRKSQYDELESWERCPESEEADEKRIWNGIMKTLHEPFAVASQAMDEGLEHVGYVLELIPKPKKKKGDDVEAANNTEAKPGDAAFADYLDQKMRDFYGKRGETLKTWAREKGLSEDAFNSAQKMPQPEDPKDMTPDSAQHRRDQQQLYLLLYLEHLLYSTGTAIADLVRFADKKVESGAMKKKKLIVPGKRRLKKWILSIGNEDSSADHESPDSLEGGNNNIYMGAGFNPKKDPEHLPPTTAWQKFGNGLRVIPRFLGSTESAFGFRVACATLTIGIIAFLKDTQTFFIQQRLVWAMIIIAIGMTMTSGQSMFGFFGRIAGTALAMVFSIVIYYIVDGHTAGVIVMLWFFIFMEMYFFLKFPRFIPVWLVCIVTQVLILGYELQVRKIGYEAASRGQPYYPVYELAPYRLACVAGGSFVAFIWTIFPYPLSDRSWLRKDLGSTLYLLANYYSVIHTTIGARMHNAEGDMGLKSSPGRRLEKVRHHIFGKLLLLLPSVKQHADWQKWEITIGGKFPKESYDGVTLRATNIMNYLSLMSYATTTWAKANEAEKETPETKSVWLRDLAALVDSIGPTSHEITSILSLLSASVKTGTALPPYLRVPKPYQLSQRLEQLDPNILDAKHVTEPGYSAYAVMQVASSLVVDDLERLVEHVRDLVGETDFSFKVVMSESTIVGSESGDKGKRD